VVEVKILYFSTPLHFCGGAFCIVPHPCESVCGQMLHSGLSLMTTLFSWGQSVLAAKWSLFFLSWNFHCCR